MPVSSVVDPAWHFATFREAIGQLPAGPLRAEQLLLDRFRLYRVPPVEGYYAPFDFLNPEARVVLVGITPGMEQMRVAFEYARDAVIAGASDESALRSAKRAASFAGPMRVNLVAMLDGIGLHRALRLSSTSRMWSDRADVLHPTSAIRYPVFRNGSNYTGHSPDIDQHPVFRSFISRLLRSELDSVPNSLVIPLGDAASRALQLLCESRQLDSERLLAGFPHPSGSNGHRVRQFAERRASLAAAVSHWFDR